MANGEKGKGRSQNQRLKLFYLLDYLLENTDETHTVKVQEIIDHFDNYYKIPVEQKTVCSDLHLLDEYGYETQYDGRTRGWRIVDREFDTQELQLLIDSVQSSRFITQKQARYSEFCPLRLWQQPKREKDQNTRKRGIFEHFAWIFLP